jgi:hypothetical protein
MEQKALLDLYSDYLVASFGSTTATGLSQLMDGDVSHDQITRHLSGPKKTSADLWHHVKALAREIQSEAAVLIIDDSIEEKPYTDENDIVCWHYDHAKNQQTKGINFLSALYYSQEVSLPVGFELIAKTEFYIDVKTGKEKRRCPTTKNEYCKELIRQAIANQLPFRFVLFDTWFSSADNMKFIKREQKRDFVCPLKTNRKVALSSSDKAKGRYQRLDTLELETNAVREIYLEGVEFPLMLAKEVLANEDGSTGIIYLVCSDTSISFDEITTNYRKRWQVECYHKSLKQNASLAKSPTQTVTTQTNHFFAALCGYIKLERLKIKTKTNHFALKSKLYVNALQSAFKELTKLKLSQTAA